MSKGIRQKYNEDIHKKELPAWKKVVSLIARGKYLLTSVRLDKMPVGDGYRLTVYLVEKE